MILYFVSRNYEILGLASTNLSDGYKIISDELTEDIDSGVASLTASIAWDDDTRLQLEEWTGAGNYILTEHNKDAEMFAVITHETDTADKAVTIYAEDAGLDLINEIAPAYTADATHNIAWYINYFLGDSDFEIGTNEIPSLTRKLTWDGDSTVTERLRSIATQFGNAELSYSFAVENLRITHKYINIWSKRGTDAGQELRLGRDINSIRVITSAEELYTGLIATGNTPEGADVPISLKGYHYDDGDIFVDANGRLLSRSGADEWGRMTKGNSRSYIMGRFTYETATQSELCNRAVTYLKAHKTPAINYEVNIERGLENSRIGDRINIVDDKGGIYVSARILALKTSVTQHKKEATLGEYLIKSSGISDRVAQMAVEITNARKADQALASQLQIVTETVDSLYTLEVDSEIQLGTAFLKARLLNGNTDVKTDYDPNWFKWVLRSENGEKLLGRGYDLNVSMSIVGYASTVLCKFIRPQLYDLTDHELTAITDQNLDPVEVSFAGIYNQPVATRNLLKSSIKALRATAQEVGTPTLSREVNLYEKDAMRKFTQHFWTEETGEYAGAHITEIGKDEFLNDPNNGGGNLLATSTGITVRDGLTDLASFGAGGMLIGKTSEKHIGITDKAFNVYDEDGSVSFGVNTENSLSTSPVGYISSVSGVNDTYHSFSTQLYLRGHLEDNRVYFAVSASGTPTSYTNYIEPTTETQTITIDGVEFGVRISSASTITVICSNTNTAKRYVGIQGTDQYYETLVKVNDAVLDTKYKQLALIDTTGVSLGAGYCTVHTYGKIAQVSLFVYNTASIAVGSMIYMGSLLNYLPINDVSLVGVYGANQVIIGSLSSDGTISVTNTGRSAFASTASSPIALKATYIFK